MEGFKALLAILFLLAVTYSVNGCAPSNLQALLSFKQALNEPYLGIFNTWKGAACWDSWYGVHYDPATGKVADVILRGESEDPIFEKSGRSGFMTGSISPSICQLEQLNTLVIADWKGVSGPIPDCLPSSLPNLCILDLAGNQLTGRIPADIGLLHPLTVLNLADNQLTAMIPGSIVNLGSLMHLNLSSNKLTGQIPADVGKLTMLSRALLSRNQLTGSSPSSFFNKGPYCIFKSYGIQSNCVVVLK